MKFDHIEYTIGEHFLPALINGDYSGLEDSEIEQFDDFLRGAGADYPAASSGHWAVEDDGENFTRCEVTNLFSRCAIVRLYFPISQEG